MLFSNLNPFGLKNEVTYFLKESIWRSNFHVFCVTLFLFENLLFSPVTPHYIATFQPNHACSRVSISLFDYLFIFIILTTKKLLTSSTSLILLR